MFGIAAAIYVYCTYVFVENKNLKQPSFLLKACLWLADAKTSANHSQAFC